ncbi:MAG: hypothetical protein VX278_12870 [Myxococcota bacterium]|nr:hypothetical protein [Myxococcota bacterium]
MKNYRFEFYTKKGQPFSYYIEPISKEAFAYWSTNGGCAALFRHINEVTEIGLTNPKEIEKFLDAEFSNIPPSARVIPTAEKLNEYYGNWYSYSSFLSGWIYHFDAADLQNYAMDVYDVSDNEKDAPMVWGGTLADLVQKNTQALAQKKYKTRKVNGHYMHLIQSERARIIGHMEMAGEWDPARLRITTQIDDFYGPCLRPDSFRYQNDNGEYKRANVDWEVWSAQGHPFDLYDGIEICEPV